MNPMASLAAILDSAAFSPLDRHFATLMQEFAGGDCPELVLAAALVSRRLAEGNSCFNLDELAGKTFPESPAENIPSLKLPRRAELEKLLRATPVVGQPSANTPLSFSRSRLHTATPFSWNNLSTTTNFPFSYSFFLPGSGGRASPKRLDELAPLM